MNSNIDIRHFCRSTHRIIINGTFIGFMTYLDDSTVVINFDKCMYNLGLGKNYTFDIGVANKLLESIAENNLV